LAVRNLQRRAYTKNPCVTDPNKPCEIRVDLLTFIYTKNTWSNGIGDLGREIIMKRVALYIRVSTSKQDTENQRRELQAVADRSGWKIVKVYEDAGISGAKGRDQRPGLDAMMKAVNAKEFDMVATWSVDRLGRSLTDLLGILQGLHEKGVGLFLHQQGLDTSTTAGKAMFQMLGVFAEFERGIIRERVNAGLARARAKGTKLGRRRVEPAVEARILELRAGGEGILKIGRKLGIGTSVVQRVFKQEPQPS
jgi:DNA invertase Pin-like site-specific DNA recombinase